MAQVQANELKQKAFRAPPAKQKAATAVAKQASAKAKSILKKAIEKSAVAREKTQKHDAAKARVMKPNECDKRGKIVMAIMKKYNVPRDHKMMGRMCNAMM